MLVYGTANAWRALPARREVFMRKRSGRGAGGAGGGVRRRLRGAMSSLGHEESGQGTTEYAILVGVLVVIAIIAVIAFHGKVQELWTAISDGINSL